MDASDSVLLVCTGNIFRSLSAELALSSLARRHNLSLTFASAGTAGGPELKVDGHVADVLSGHGLDSRPHASRRLTQEIVDSADVIVAMHTDHQQFIRDKFGREARLYRTLAGHADAALPDTDEAVPDYKTNRAARNAHITATIDSIVADSRAVLDALPLRQPA